MLRAQLKKSQESILEVLGQLFEDNGKGIADAINDPSLAQAIRDRLTKDTKQALTEELDPRARLQKLLKGEKGDKESEAGGDGVPSMFTKPPQAMQRLLMAAFNKDSSQAQNKFYHNANSQLGTPIPPFPSSDELRSVPEKWEKYWQENTDRPWYLHPETYEHFFGDDVE